MLSCSLTSGSFFSTIICFTFHRGTTSVSNASDALCRCCLPHVLVVAGGGRSDVPPPPRPGPDCGPAPGVGLPPAPPSPSRPVMSYSLGGVTVHCTAGLLSFSAGSRCLRNIYCPAWALVTVFAGVRTQFIGVMPVSGLIVIQANIRTWLEHLHL